MAHGQWFKLVRQYPDSLRVIEYMCDNGWWRRWYPVLGNMFPNSYQRKNSDGTWTAFGFTRNRRMVTESAIADEFRVATSIPFHVGDRVVIINHPRKEHCHVPLETVGQVTIIRKFSPTLYVELEGMQHLYPTCCLEPAG